MNPEHYLSKGTDHESEIPLQHQKRKKPIINEEMLNKPRLVEKMEESFHEQS